MRYVIHSQPPKVTPLTIWNGWVISPHTLLGMWLFIYVGFNLPRVTKGASVVFLLDLDHPYDIWFNANMNRNGFLYTSQFFIMHTFWWRVVILNTLTTHNRKHDIICLSSESVTLTAPKLPCTEQLQIKSTISVDHLPEILFIRDSDIPSCMMWLTVDCLVGRICTYGTGSLSLCAGS